MARILVVPIYLDALVLEKPTAVVEAFADFSRLPYFNGEIDMNPDVPNVSEEILSQPFQNQNLYLKRGVHLHWALPDALTRGRRKSGGTTEFPAVPNRWLITRKIKETPQAKWIVESDYLQPHLPTYLFNVEPAFAPELNRNQVSDALRQQFQSNGTTLSPMAVAAVLQAGHQWVIVDTDQSYMISRESQTLHVYLNSSPDVDPAGRITYPVSMDHNQPFGYLGRVVKWEDWPLAGKEESRYLPKLTAVGYGEPAFAAFYPNCHSVFGFWDSLESNLENLQGITYEILGWYSASEQDFFANWIRDFKNPGDAAHLLEEQLSALKESNQWIIPALEEKLRALKQTDKSATLDSAQVFPTQMICYAQISFEQATANTGSAQGPGVKAVIGPPDVSLTTSGPVNFPITITGAKKIQLEPAQVNLNQTGSVNGIVSVINGTSSHPTVTVNHITGRGAIGISIAAGIAYDSEGHPNPSSDPSNAVTVDAIALGSTGTEALSIYLGDQLNPTDKRIIEEQLEALHLANGLEHRRLDIGLKFQEARHTKGFTAVPSGNIWTLRPESESQPGAQTDNLEQASLPAELAVLLNTLNNKQQEHDQATFEIESLQYQLFADWYKYMLCAYPPLDSPDEYPEIDEAKGFVDRYDWAPLDQKINKVGALRFEREADAVGQPALSSQPSGESLAAIVVQAANDLLDSEAMSKFQNLVDSDILDWTGFLSKLEGYALLSFPVSPVEPQADAPKELAAHILSALNALSSSRDFYTAVEKLPNLANDSLNLIRTLKYPTAPQEPTEDLKEHVWRRLNRQLLESIFPEQIAHRPNYVLRRIPAPRYWQPNEPVVLLAGDIAEPTDRHGPQGELQKEGLLHCQVVSVDDFAIANNKMVDEVREQIASQVSALGSQAWDKQPWHPILLEWQVEFFPAQEGSNLNHHNRDYAPDYLAKNYYQLLENDADFSTSAVTIAHATNIYSGRSILTPHAKDQLEQKLEKYLKEELLDQYYQARAVKVEDRTLSLLGAQIKDVRAWYEQSYPADFRDPAYTALRAYQSLQETHILAQSLGGFNQALLMQKQALQLPIGDPLGFPDYQELTQRVYAAVGNGNRSAPQPFNNFNPIRAGALKITRLRLIDTFGQVRDIDGSHPVTPESMPLTNDGVLLYPRLAQSARLNFRWLAASSQFAGEDEAEMNDHPATSPICGWILPNNLDGRLMFYEQSGRALGSLDQAGNWTPAPEPVPVSISSISSTPLKNLINYLVKQNTQDLEASGPKKTTFIEQFMNAIENALESIDPENFAHHEALALLMGRPIAVVRASLNLELRGRPAINQDWNIFQQDMQETQTVTDPQGIPHLVRTTDKFTKVTFPIRIGEFRQLNDGLIGYWVENEHGIEDSPLYAPQAVDEEDVGQIDHSRIVIHRPDTPAMVAQSIDDPPHTLTMLMDPRGVVHATCGILPTKSIQIPSDQFADALRAIEVAFLAAPILTDPGRVNLPLPEEPGYQWSWLAKENGVWADESEIGPVSPLATFVAKQAIREGWLKLRQKPDEENLNTNG